MSATKIMIEGLADAWTAAVEVGGRVVNVVGTDALSCAMNALAAYDEMSAPPPEDKPAPVEEPEEEAPAGDSDGIDTVRTDPPPDTGAADSGNDNAQPETPPVAAAPQEADAAPAAEPVPTVVITPEPDGGGTVTAAPEVQQPVPGPTLEQRAQARSGLNDGAWAGLPPDDRDALITEQDAHERTTAPGMTVTAYPGS